MIRLKDQLLKQIGISFIYKILAFTLSFLLLKYMLSYLGIEYYGVWSVMLSFLNWMVFFDFGIANGVKNKVSAALSENNYQQAKEYISTGYITITFIVMILMLASIISFKFINWNYVFNVNFISLSKLELIVTIIFASILLNFIFSLINQIFLSVQKSSLVVLNQCLFQSISIILLFILIKFTNSNLKYVAIIYGTSLITSHIIFSLLYFRKERRLIPSFHSFKSSKIKDISSLGLKFFFLQLVTIIILSTDRFLIIHLVDSKYVTSYDVLYKYFSILYIGHGLINAPLWTKYTEKYNIGDISWILKTLKRLNLLMVLYIAITVILIIASQSIIQLWLNNKEVVLSTSNSVFMGIMMLALIWYSIYAFLSNGIEETKIQLISGIFGSIINIPLSVLFVKYFGMGLNGVILATIISLSIYGISGPVYSYKLLKNKQLQIN